MRRFLWTAPLAAHLQQLQAENLEIPAVTAVSFGLCKSQDVTSTCPASDVSILASERKTLRKLISRLFSVHLFRLPIAKFKSKEPKQNPQTCESHHLTSPKPSRLDIDSHTKTETTSTAWQRPTRERRQMFINCSGALNLMLMSDLMVANLS